MQGADIHHNPTPSPARQTAAAHQLDVERGVRVRDADLAPFATLTPVKSLSISGFNLTDACLPHLAQLKQLEELSLYTSKVSQAGGDKLRAALPSA